MLARSRRHCALNDVRCDAAGGGGWRAALSSVGIGSLIGACTIFFAVSDIARVESVGRRVGRRMIRGAAVGCAGGVFFYLLVRHRLLPPASSAGGDVAAH